MAVGLDDGMAVGLDIGMAMGLDVGMAVVGLDSFSALEPSLLVNCQKSLVIKKIGSLDSLGAIIPNIQQTQHYWRYTPTLHAGNATCGRRLGTATPPPPALPPLTPQAILLGFSASAAAFPSAFVIIIIVVVIIIFVVYIVLIIAATK